MNGFFAARCERCGKRFGWAGRLVDRPPCPRCRHQIAPEILEAEQRTIERVLTAHERPSGCGVPGHTEADICGSGSGPGMTNWCGACAAEAQARRSAASLRRLPPDEYNPEEEIERREARERAREQEP